MAVKFKTMRLRPEIYCKIIWRSFTVGFFATAVCGLNNSQTAVFVNKNSAKSFQRSFCFEVVMINIYNK